MAALLLLLAADLAWGGLYIRRTSFLYGETRVFCLWDDAMISMRYAKNLAEGEGLVWNPAAGHAGERVQGFSNLGVTLMMAGLHLLAVDPLRVSLFFQLLNLLALAAALLLTWRIGLRLFDGEGAVAFAAAAGVALSASLHVWSLQGADAGVVCVWLLAALSWLVAAGGRWPRGLFAWLALGALIRLDGAIFCVTFLAFSLLYPGRRWRRLGAGAAVFAGVAGGLLLFGWLYYGDPLPNTYYLKATGSPLRLMLRSGLEQLRPLLAGLVPALGLAALAVARARPRRELSLCAALVLVALAYHVRVGGDWQGEYGSRFVAPVLPLLSLLVAAGARELLGPARGARAAVLLAAVSGVALLLTPREARIEWFDPRAPTMLAADKQKTFAYARYFREHTAPDTTLAVHYAGIPPYFSERPAVDVLGKSDRHIAKLRVPRFLPGHSKWDWDYVLRERKPDVFIVATRGLRERADFRRSYLLVRNRRGLRFFLRRDALARLDDPRAVLIDLETGERVSGGRSSEDAPRRRRSSGPVRNAG